MHRLRQAAYRFEEAIGVAVLARGQVAVEQQGRDDVEAGAVQATHEGAQALAFYQEPSVPGRLPGSRGPVVEDLALFVHSAIPARSTFW